MNFPTEIVGCFRIDGQFIEAKRWGSGNVNDTFLATFRDMEITHRYIFQRINHIFISHLHGDHYFGLIGLISSMHLLGRNKDLHIYAHKELKVIVDLKFNSKNVVVLYVNESNS